MTLLFLVLVTCFLAYSNGANDNFKGVASLFGSRTTGYRRAIGWATATTFAGSIASMALAQALLTKFSGRGIVPDQIVGSESFVLAVALGAGLTVIVATLTGFPVSTTHALTGAIVGAGLVAVGTGVNVQSLGGGFLLPLALSPILALVLAAGFYLVLRFLRLTLGITKEWCICVGETQQVVPIAQPASVMALQGTVWSAPLTVSAGEIRDCAERYTGAFLGIRSQTIMDAAHFFSAGVVSFARGLNDTPKIAAMLLVVRALDIRWGIVAMAVAIAIGGLLSAGRVAETMSHRITGMNHGQGLAANFLDRSSGDPGNQIRPSGFDDARVGGIALRDRIDCQKSQRRGRARYCACLAADVAVRRAHQRDRLLAGRTRRHRLK
jgi:PiT family inorganic phosphate transporter